MSPAGSRAIEKRDFPRVRRYGTVCVGEPNLPREVIYIVNRIQTRRSLRPLWVPCVLFLLAVFIAVPPTTSAQEPGTTGDPIVSKSYLDQFFRFRSVVIPKGDTVQLTPGALIVTRSGKLKIRAPRGKSLIDLTDGKELAADTLLPAFHLVLVPETPGLLLEAQSMSLVLAMGLHPER